MEERRGRTALAGFVLGITGCGTTASASLLTLIIVLNKISKVENGVASLFSQLMMTLCGLIIAIGVVVLWGSIDLWKHPSRGGAINFGIGMVLIALSQGMLIFLSDFVPPDMPLYLFLSALYYMMSITSTLSGILGIGLYLMRQR
jgi:hypothetical protein